MWIAKKVLRNVGANREMRRPGDAVPEAAEWPKQSAYVKKGYIEWIDDERVGVKEASPQTSPIEPLGEIEPAPSTKPKQKKKKGAL